MVTYIGEKNLEAFKAFLTPDVPVGSGGVLLYGAIDGDVSCGALAMTLDNDGAGLSSLYVHADYRRRGHGTDLVLKALEVAAKAKLSSMQAAWVLSEKGSAPLAALLTKCGFTPADNSMVYSASLESLAAAVPGSTSAAGVLPFKNLPAYMLRDFYNKQAENPDALFLSVNPVSLDNELSFACVSSGHMQGGIWISNFGGTLFVDSLFFTQAGFRSLPVTIWAALRTAYAKYPPSTPVMFAAVNPAVSSLIKKLFPRTAFDEGEMLSMECLITREFR